jgi:hypothetical protein
MHPAPLPLLQPFVYQDHLCRTRTNSVSRLNSTYALSIYISFFSIYISKCEPTRYYNRKTLFSKIDSLFAIYISASILLFAHFLPELLHYSSPKAQPMLFFWYYTIHAACFCIDPFFFPLILLGWVLSVLSVTGLVVFSTILCPLRVHKSPINSYGN